MNTNQALYTKNIAEYFNFIAPGDIRLQNTRIGIETILYEYIDCGRSPEEIAQIYQSISLEQVYATILYYLQNKEFVSAYMQNWLEHGHRMREQQRLNPPPVSEKLRQLRTERQAKKQIHDAEISD
ncbi:MAG: DUF433 domain-containing protein [Gloeotrichia echinulata DVL01]|nr:DUF433 domain-containing protein [Gloeotrichia echinulata DEX184]